MKTAEGKKKSIAIFRAITSKFADASRNRGDAQAGLVVVVVVPKQYQFLRDRD